MLWPAPDRGAGFERGLWAEKAGYDDLWLPDAEGLQDPITFAAALGTATTKVRLCTGIVPVFNRPPPLLATGVVAAEQRAPGRFVLGLGPSTNNMIDRWYGLPYDKPLTRVRETIELLRKLFDGEKSNYQGETLRSTGFKLMEQPSAPVPIFIGAIGPKMLALAGEMADGVLLNDFTPPDRLDWALEKIDQGAKRAGRRAEDLEIVKRRGIFLSPNSTAGLAYFRSYIGFYGAAPAYQKIMVRLGYKKAVEQIREGYAEGDRAKVANAVSDDMIDRLFAYGDVAKCQDIVRKDFTAGIDSAVISPQGDSAQQYSAGAEAFSRDEFQV
ncbi:MAG: LLM class flavin-dependent oxidoreductase [Gammaproteobacteria bacterium]